MSLEQHVYLACVWEATIPKPGNVHPKASFDDMNYSDFVRSAEAIAPVLGNSNEARVGMLVYQAAEATMSAVGKNTNLGIILLLAPLVLSSRRGSSVSQVLNDLDVQDAVDVYAAIRLMQPGGMGQVAEQDVAQAPIVTLREAMRLAEDRDLIAKQYVNDYREVIELLRAFKLMWRDMNHQYTYEKTSFEASFLVKPLQYAVQYTFLYGMERFGETLIRRKCGVDIEQQARAKAKRILDLGWPRFDDALMAYHEFDTWLRADGHRRNPGTMADLIAATLFLALEQGVIPAQRP